MALWGPEGESHNGNSGFYGFSDWSTWYQGDILGNWTKSNSNLNSHQAQLNMIFDNTFILKLIYYHFCLDSKHMSTKTVELLTSKNLAEEIDLDLDFNVTNWWTMARMGGRTFPTPRHGRPSGETRPGFRQACGPAGLLINSLEARVRIGNANISSARSCGSWGEANLTHFREASRHFIESKSETTVAPLPLG
jgi:hypothetical protein